MADQEGVKTKTAEGADIYEVGFHVLPTVAEAQVGDIVIGFKEELKKRGAEILAEEAPKRVRLAYTMQQSTGGSREKYNEAYFGWIKFECMREEIGGLEEALRSNRSLLRHLLITTPRESSGPSRLC